MGWFLLRKPYPGLTEEQRININSDELHVGRGRECSVHCLSMYVSRKHLKVIPKESGSVCLLDLGSSNGTFVNQTKITPGEEFTLSVGDEIGIGNINCDSKDCFVYVVRKEEPEDTRMESSIEKSHQSTCLLVGSSSAPIELENVEGNNKSSGTRHSLERGLKRFALEPEIVVLDDDDIFSDDMESKCPKRPKVDSDHKSVDSEANGTAVDVSLQKNENGNRKIGEMNLKVVNNSADQENHCTKKDVKTHESDGSSTLGMTNAFETSLDVKSQSFINEKKTVEPAISSMEDVLEDNQIAADTNIKSTPSSKGLMNPPPPPAAKIVSKRFSLVKPINPLISSIVEDEPDMSSGTLRLSSPSLSGRASSTSACLTPNSSKHGSVEDVLSIQTSTPCVAKSCAAERDADWSPIVKNSSRHSHDSSANYTLDEEMIPIDLSDDDDDDIFPCSQLFAEDEDVKPVIGNINPEDNIVDLSNENEPEENKMTTNNEFDDIVLISSDEEEDDDDVQTANRWYMRLSQTPIKSEPIEESICIPKETSLVETNGEEVSKDKIVNLNKMESKHLEPKEDVQFNFPSETLDFSDVCKKQVIKEQKMELETKSEEIKTEYKPAEKSKEKFKEKDNDKERRKESEKEKDKEKEKEKEKEKSKQKEKAKKSKDKERDKYSRTEGENRFDKETDAKHPKSRKEKKYPKSKCTDNDNEKHRFHINSHSKRKEHKDKHDQICGTKSKHAFPDSDSDENMDIFPEGSPKHHMRSLPSPEKIPSVSESITETSPLVTLVRLEDDPKSFEHLHAPVLDTSNSSHPQNKKNLRQIELVDALPMPPRRAINRGISSTTAMKMFEGDKQKPRDSQVGKSAQPKDMKTLRKERLAEVAAQNTSKEKGNSDNKKKAPAKIKITASNRGSFLVDNDESSPGSRPKSRSDIRSKKIPKLKDKPAAILPTKSPLQEMNMSWEKSKPEERIQSPLEPVEIPTGPQPKKRVAQVPPPGFYSDSLTKECLVLLPTPNKSCLSKHNIVLNGAKPQNVKKRVKFKENLVEVREIERLPNTRPVSSSMDADRPKAMSQVSQITPPIASVMPTDELVLQDVIYDISKWNPLWLKEEKNLPSDILPPVVSNMNLPSIPKTEFLDFREYHNTMYPLLMLELWSGVSKEYNSNESRRNMIMAVDSANSAAVYNRADRMLTTLNCHMIGDEKSGRDYPRLGNLVVIDLALKDPSGKTSVIPVFGYVSFDARDSIRMTDQVHKDLLNYCPKPTFKVRFSLIIRERKIGTCVLERSMRIKNVKYVRGDLRVFQAMKNLEYMPLQYSIISPSAADEDFTLPEINGDLAYPEQLNETQKTVVLKTAAACQEPKSKIVLIQGPPGTGKSHVIASLVMQLLYRDGIYSKTNREKGFVPKVLLCTPSNNAVDLLVRRLLRKRAKLDKQLRFKMVRVGQPQFMQQDVKRVSLQELAKAEVVKNDQTVSHNVDIESWRAKLKAIENVIEGLKMNNKDIPQDLNFRQADIIRRLRVLEDRCKQQSQSTHNTSRKNFAIEREASKRILRGADIVATTLNSCMIKIMETVFPPPSKGKYNFQVCIVDEATQCLEVETLIPLLLGVKTLILVGDPNQLPATILSKVAREKGLGTSLFARLQKIFPQAPQLLDTQYRMHPEILRWPNKYFYNRRLRTPESLLPCRMSKVTPYAVLSLPFQQDKQGEVNFDEAKLVLQLAEVLVDRKAIPQNGFMVGIVTPYQSQRRTINAMLQEREFRDFVEVNTIDSYQGQEKDVTIISCVRTNGIGFLADRQRLNVALTRAKYAEFICGNFSSLDRDHMWNNLLTDARQRNCFYEIRGHCKNDELWDYVQRK